MMRGPTVVALRFFSGKYYMRLACHWFQVDRNTHICMPVLKYAYSCQRECAQINVKLISCGLYPRRTLKRNTKFSQCPCLVKDHEIYQGWKLLVEPDCLDAVKPDCLTGKP